MDVERFRADMKERVRPVDDCVHRPELPLDRQAQAALQAAIASATEHRREQVDGRHLLYALLQDEDGFVVGLLARYAPVRLRDQLESAL
jgi:ATP-dependent Clp protease ATP-binding subunit ClpA